MGQSIKYRKEIVLAACFAGLTFLVSLTQVIEHEG